MNISFKDTNGSRLPLEHVAKIVIYGNGYKLFERETDLEAYTIKPNANGEDKLSSLYRAAPVEITLNGEVKTARKENLTRKDNYTLTYTPEYLKWERRTALYIHESEISVTDLGDVLSMETDEEKNYLHAVRLHFNGPTTYQRAHSERIPAGKGWKIPDGGRWSDAYGTEERPCYDIPSRYAIANHPELENCVIKRWITVETLPAGAEIITTERYYTRMEESAERKRKRAIADKLNQSIQYRNSNEKWSHYDITKLESALGYTLHT